MQAATIGVARIGGADVVIITSYQTALHTSPRRTMVAQGAVISIVAVSSVGHKLADSILAGIVSAGIAVVAGYQRSCDAFAIDTRVVYRAGITIVTAQGTFRNASAALTVDAQQTGIFQLAGS